MTPLPTRRAARKLARLLRSYSVCALGVAALGCRVERVDADASAGASSMARPGTAQPQALLLSSERPPRQLEARLRAQMCRAITRRDDDALLGVVSSLSLLECAAREHGAAHSEALLMTRGARWGAAALLPNDYLAIEGALDSLRAAAGLRYGPSPLQSLAPCALASRPEKDAPALEAPSAPGHATDAVTSDQDAGAEPPPQDDDPAELASDSWQARALPPAGAARVSAVLLRDAHGGFHGGLISGRDAPLGPLAQDDGPTGLDVLPGQLLYVADSGASFATPARPRDLGQEPAPAAEDHRALLDGRAASAAIAARMSSGELVVQARDLLITQVDAADCQAMEAPAR